MSMEAGVVLGWKGVVGDSEEEPLYWHTPGDRSGTALPDSRDLWDFMWKNRDRITGFAHTHPGFGLPSPSHTDLTTFAAIESGLGSRLDWWILSSDGFIVLRRVDLKYTIFEAGLWPLEEPIWMDELRELSQY